MKTILLLRHAKSSWDDSSLDDFDRPLTSRGKKDAPRMGHFARKSKSVPGLVISSTAERARQTTALFADIAGIDEDEIRWNKDLYYGGSGDYLDVIQNAPDDIQTVMLVGHNPSIEECIGLLISEPSGYIARVPTAGLICIEHPATRWKQVKPGSARLKWMVVPKLIREIIK